MLDLRTWALYYKAQCSTCCFFFRFLDAIVVLLIIVTTDTRYQICLRDASMWRSYTRDISLNVCLEWCDHSVAHILATVCLTEALVLQDKPMTCDNNGGARKESGIMVAARVITSQK